MANFEQLRYDKAVALSKRLKRNILPMAKSGQMRYDKAVALSKRFKRNILPMVKSELLRYNIMRFMERCPSGLRSRS